jgi:hypothetical protein
VTEEDVNEMVAEYMPDDVPIEDVDVRLAPEGAYVTGQYPLFLKVAFETRWELGIRGGLVTARLVDFKAMNLPMTMFRNMLFKMLSDSGGKKDWLQFEGDLVLIDVDKLLASEGVSLRSNLTALRCQAGQLLVEAKAAEIKGTVPLP